MPVNERKLIVPAIQNLNKILFRFDVCSLFVVGLCGNLNGVTCEVCGLFVFSSYGHLNGATDEVCTF